ncbi:MAG TPA: cation:proton antiporter [Polyangiaceae bacterium]|nr:cation:proton antiporter [Polyangiaceae bacterium]
MGHIALLDELAVIACVGVFVTVVLARLRLPTVAGLLAAGALLGPNGLGLLQSAEMIEQLAEVGVVLLLFTIGLEFSLARLSHIWRQVAAGGSIQVGLTIAATVAVGSLLHWPFERSLFYGFVFALSSTAIVLRALTERRELDAPHGRFVVGALIFQDLCVVPMVLIVPLLGGAEHAGSAVTEIGSALGKALVVVVGIVLVARLIVPRIFAWVTAVRSREVFLLAVIGVCTGTAWLTSQAGLSLALGAFLGGMVVADTEYGHRALGDMLPLRDVFTSIFFVSLGMLFDVRSIIDQPLLVLGLLAGFLVAKGMLATLAALAMRFPARVAWLAGVGLAQFGEFGFVLARLGRASNLVTDADVSSLLAAGILSMFFTPLLVRVAPHISAGEKLLRPLERLLGARGVDECAPEHEGLEGHVVVVGFGVAGRLVARALSACEVPYLVLELNAETVRKSRASGEPVYYGDAASVEALEHAGISRARALVLLMNDPQATVRVIEATRRVSSDLPVFVRAHFLAEREHLLSLGATDVIAEEVEAGMEVLAQVLRKLAVPRNVILEQVEQARASTQMSVRAPTVPRRTLGVAEELADLKIESALLRDESHAVGRALAELELQSKTRALIVALKRDGKLLDHFEPTEKLRAGDIAFLVGSSRAVARAVRLLDNGNDDQGDGARVSTVG